MAKPFDILKNIIIIVIILQIAPSFLKALKKNYSRLLESKTAIGKITIKGSIESTEEYSCQIKDLYCQDIKALLLKIESPGGSAGSSYALFNEIMSFKNQHPTVPIIALTESICASGGYYIACAADHIIASRTALIGSIGVYLSHFELKEFIEQHKIYYNVIKSGKYKAAGNPFLALTQEQKEQLQSLSQNIYEQFVKDVLDRRPKIITDINEIAQGQAFTGNQALELGLIDEVGSLETAIKALKEKGSFDNAIEWIEPSSSLTFWGALTGQTKLPDIIQLFYSFYNQCSINSAPLART